MTSHSFIPATPLFKSSPNEEQKQVLPKPEEVLLWVFFGVPSLNMSDKGTENKNRG